MTRHLATLLLAAILGTACEQPPLPEFGEPVDLAAPAGADSLGPKLTAGSGQLLLSWMEREDEGGRLRVAELGTDAWGPAIDVVTDPRMFVNWADLPGVLSIVKGAKDNSHWVAHWLSRSGEAPYAYDIRLMQSVDGGKSWSSPVTPHGDGTHTEHGFVAKFRSPKGVGLAWLDGRKTIGDDGMPAAGGGMTLRSAVVTPADTLEEEHLVDDLVCDCCPTSVVVSSGGPLLVYRNRTSDEIRDIYVTRFTNGAWTPGVPVANDGWVISGCPVNGPVIAASGDLVGVAWFTGADGRPRVQASVSRDGGKTFPEPVAIATDRVAGYVDLVFAGQSMFVVSWAENAGDHQDVRVRTLKADGTPGAPTTVGRSRAAMSVPQMEYRQGELVFAWTVAEGETSRVVSTRVPVNFGR